MLPRRHLCFSVLLLPLGLAAQSLPDSSVPKVRDLKGVEVKGRPPLIERRADRLIYNVSADTTNIGSNTADIMKKVPLLSVDLEGNPTMRGKSNIKILLNGKPSGLFASNVAQAMRTIPGNMIKSVEVYTSSMAKYEVQGYSGVVNIILKKNPFNGYNATLNTKNGYANNDTWNRAAGGGLYIKEGKWELNFNTSVSDFRNRARDVFRRDDWLGSDTLRFRQEGATRGKGVNWSGFAGADYTIDSVSYLNASVQYAFKRRTSQSDLESRYDLKSTFLQEGESRSETAEYNIQLVYGRKFRNQGDLSLTGQFSNADDNAWFNTIQLAMPSGNILLRDVSSNLTSRKVYTIQADYSQLLGTKNSISAGVKALIRNIESDVQATLLDTASGQEIKAPGRMGHYSFDQRILSAYALFVRNFEKGYSATAGGRFEHAQFRGDFGQQFTRDYPTFIPNLQVSKSFKNNSRLSLNYSRSIQRPGMEHLNPFINIIDPQNIRIGNPDLVPEATDKAELSYYLDVKQHFFYFSLYKSHTRKTIGSYWESLNDSVKAITFRNLGSSSSTGLELYTALSLFSGKLRVMPGASVYWYNVSSEALSNSGLIVRGELNSELYLKNNWSLELYGFYNTPTIQLQGSTSAISYTMFSVNKKLLKKRLNVLLGVVEPVRGEISQHVTVNGPAYSQRRTLIYPIRQVMLEATFTFGKMNFESKRKSKKVKNDDIKKIEKPALENLVN